VLLGHSYGGAVITEAGNPDKIVALVYVAAYAPDRGESVSLLIADLPPGAAAPPVLPPRDGFVFLDRAKFAASFAGDLPARQVAFMADSQVPCGVHPPDGRDIRGEHLLPVAPRRAPPGRETRRRPAPGRRAAPLPGPSRRPVPARRQPRRAPGRRGQRLRRPPGRRPPRLRLRHGRAHPSRCLHRLGSSSQHGHRTADPRLSGALVRTGQPGSADSRPADTPAANVISR